MLPVATWDVSGAREQVHVACSLPPARLSPFQYIANLRLPEDVPLYVEGCACEDSSCLLDDCPCPQAYDENGLLIDSEQPVYECGEACSCPPSCISRKVQRGLQLRLEVFDTGSRGLGLRTLERIESRSFVVSYIGRLVPPADAPAIYQANAAVGCNYLLVLRENRVGKDPLLTCIDAGETGNVARFINHSCDPNLVPVAVRVGSPIPLVAFFASKIIEAGSELTFSYGQGTGTHRCLCGTVACSGFLPFDGL